MKNKKFSWSKFSVIIYWVMIIALLGLYFTNDFGLVDIRKTAIITALGVDIEGEETLVTAQIAQPQNAESGQSATYTSVQGSGLNIADALKEINSKTGFYPGLQFCKLILLGDSVKEEQLFERISCLYRKNYSELTAMVAMCEGKASEMLSLAGQMTDNGNDPIQQALTQELKKSALASTVNLKDIATKSYSSSKACFMPYVEKNKPGTSEPGGNGENTGGESVQSKEGGSEGSGGEGQSQGGSGGDGSNPAEFTARKTAIFANGNFCTLLDEKVSFAFNILFNDIDNAGLVCDVDGKHYNLRLRGADGGVSLKVEKGIPYLTLEFSAKAAIQGLSQKMNMEESAHDDVVEPSVLEGAEKEIQARLGELVQICIDNDCDILGAKTLLFKKQNKYFEAFKDDLLTRMQVQYKVSLKSLN